MGAHSYKEAGVNIAAGNALIETIKPLAAATAIPGTTSALGGFGAFFDLKAAGWRDPILVATTDGVGTKLKLAFATNHHSTIGIDLVAMSVNDLVVQGATPLFFLDYYATSRLDVAVAADVITGIATGCQKAGCALIGGETAEMPGFYAKGEYDLAGFAVGAVERDSVRPWPCNPGDVILGLRASGLHSNGFSLVRQIVDTHKLAWEDPAPFAKDLSLAQALLAPTKIYVQSLLAAMPLGIRALAHITGGGLLENIPRVLAPKTAARLDCAAMPLPGVFTWLRDHGKLSLEDLARTFNCGIGMIVICHAKDSAAISNLLNAEGEEVLTIGEIVATEESPHVILTNEETWHADA
ncbi:MAG: phosphoribosylformylglycinamidine cyclo-ligase [Alphaproteobacteria bacterium]